MGFLEVSYPSRSSSTPMLPRAWLALLLLLSSAGSAQDLDPARSAVVRISGTRGDTTVRGSGFVVSLEPGKATIVTVSHVIAGAQQIEVTFEAAPTEHYPAGDVLGIDPADDSKGLAVFQVRGALPAGVTFLSFDVENRPQPGEELFLLGFPQMATTARTNRRALSAWSGTMLLIDQGVGEGFSGGPVLKAGKVVGVIINTDEQTTYAVSARVVREAMEGWGVKLGGQTRPSAPGNPVPAQPTPRGDANCKPGEERTENGMVYVRICPGTSLMGSLNSDPLAEENEKPAHFVTLSEFWIGKTEVDIHQYRLFRSDYRGNDSWPVTGVNWAEAQAACRYFGGRLPTEAEWEYAARAGTKSAWPFGNAEILLGDYAWYGEKAGKDPHTASLKKPNSWGLHDMHGNVAEWVADWYEPYSPLGQFDPSGPKTGQLRVVRGGSFADSARTLRSAFRGRNSPEDRRMYIGFRCTLDAVHQP